jgi:hypothetical protein
MSAFEHNFIIGFSLTPPQDALRLWFMLLRGAFFADLLC